VHNRGSEWELTEDWPQKSHQIGRGEGGGVKRELCRGGFSEEGQGVFESWVGQHLVF